MADHVWAMFVCHHNCSAFIGKSILWLSEYL